MATLTRQMMILVSPEEKEEWQKKAADMSLSLGAWIRYMCNGRVTLNNRPMGSGVRPRKVSKPKPEPTPPVVKAAEFAKAVPPKPKVRYGNERCVQCKTLGLGSCKCQK